MKKIYFTLPFVFIARASIALPIVDKTNIVFTNTLYSFHDHRSIIIPPDDLEDNFLHIKISDLACCCTPTRTGQLNFTPYLSHNSYKAAWNSPDTTFVQPAARKKHFITYNFILPSAAIAYGAIALKSPLLRDWNEGIRNEIWVKNPHNQLHIDSYVQWLPGASVYALNFSGIKGEHNFIDRSIIYGMALLIQSSAVATIKKISGEIRPNGEGNESFPSGHTSNAFAGAEFMRMEYKNKSPWFAIAGYGAATFTGFLRMYNNRHWLSDVLAGAGIGVLSTDLSYILYPVLKRVFSKKHSSETMIVPTYQKATFGMAVLHVF